MSLLLDALKDADGRRNKPGAAAATAGVPSPGNETQVLSILEEPALGATPSAAIAAANAVPAGRTGHASSERPTRRPRAGGAGRKPDGMRRLMLPVLLVVTILGMGAGYVFLGSSQDLPKLLPASLPATAAQATVDALPDEPDVSMEVSRGGHVRVEPGLKPAEPQRAEVIVPPSPPVPEPAPEREAPPAIQAVRSTPGIGRSAGGSLQRAYAALRTGDLVAAEAGYREALRDAPQQVDAHLGLAVMAQARGDHAEALSHFRAVLESTPDHARAWSGLSDLAGPQELDGMESRLRGLIARRPAATLQFALGNVLARQSRWAEAQESYFSATSGEPDNAEYAFNMAVALDHLGKREATMTWYARALDLARDGRPVQFDAASAAQRLAALREVGR